ncbi:MAG: lysophospholipid acyltransferase family protein [Alphaproteobacteria bacterium]
MQTTTACLKFLLFTILTLITIPIQLIVMLFHKGKYSYALPYLWQNATIKIFSIKLKIIGTPITNQQIIYVSNHISYLDIPVIGSVLRASFVAKKDVASWPLFGFLSKLQQTAFISRNRNNARQEKNTLDQMLINGKSLIIFPEGTSTDGREVLPFKSSLFSIALKNSENNMLIQPITLTMTLANGKKIENQETRDIYAWHINMDTPLHVHLWGFAKTKGAEITMEFHPPINPSDYSDRKELAKACHSTVSNTLNKI